jgi:hypothetical protein
LLFLIVALRADDPRNDLTPHDRCGSKSPEQVTQAAPPAKTNASAATPAEAIQKSLRVSKKCETDKNARETCRISHQGTTFEESRTLGAPAFVKATTTLVALGSGHKITVRGICFLLQTSDGTAAIGPNLEVAKFGKESSALCFPEL